MDSKQSRSAVIQEFERRACAQKAHIAKLEIRQAAFELTIQIFVAQIAAMASAPLLMLSEDIRNALLPKP